MAGSMEVGSGHFAVIPSFRGFRRAVVAEANASGAEGSRGFSKAMAAGGKSAGTETGRGFSAAFKGSVDVSPALAAVEKEVRAAAEAMSRARLSEADAAGRVRVAEAQLAEARAKYGEGSSQVIRAEERLASVKRAHGTQSDRLAAATSRLSAAQAELAALGGRSAAQVSSLSSAFEPLRARVSAAVQELGVFYRTSSLLSGVRSLVDGVSTAWTVAKGVMTGLGPVVIAPIVSRVKEAASATASWARDAALKIPGVGRAVEALRGPLDSAKGWFSALTTAGAGVARALGSMFGPVGQQIASGLKAGFDAAVRAAGSAASAIANAFTQVLGAVGTGAVAGLVASLKGGFDRLSSVETATARMRGFGIEAGLVDDVMRDVKDSVQGTVFTVGEMGNAAAQALISGIQPGQQLNAYMGFLKNTATAAGAPLSEINQIMGKIVANAGGPLTTELTQLADRGIPVWTTLSKAMGVTVQEVKELASEGKITSDMIVQHLGGAMAQMAEEVGGTTESVLTNMRSSFSRFGETLMQESFPGVKAVANGIREIMNLAIALVGPIKQALGLDQVGPAIQWIEGLTERVRAFRELITSGSAEGESALAGIVERAKELAPLFGAAAIAILPLIGGFLSSLPVIGPMLAGLGPGLLGGFAPLLALGGIVAMLGMDPAAFAGMIDGLVGGVVGMVESVIASLVPLIEEFVPVLGERLAAGLPALVQGAVTLFLGLVQAASTVLPVLIAAVVGLIPQIVTALVNAIPVLLQGGVQLLLGLVQAATVAIPAIVSAVIAAVPQIVTALVTALPLIIEGGLALFMGLLEALVTLIPMLLTSVIEMVPVLIEGLLSMLPALIMGALELFLGLITGLLQALPDIIVAVIAAVPQLLTALISQLPLLITSAVELFLGLVTGLIKATPEIITAVIGMIPKIITALIDAVPQLIQAGVDLISGLVKGIADSAGMVMDAIGGVVNGAIDWAKGLLGIASPSRVFRTIGDQVGQGLAGGLDGAQGRVESAAGRLVDATQRAFEGLEPVEVPVAARVMESAGLSVAGAAAAGAVVASQVEVSLAGLVVRASIDGEPFTLLIEEHLDAALAPFGVGAAMARLGTAR